MAQTAPIFRQLTCLASKRYVFVSRQFWPPPVKRLAIAAKRSAPCPKILTKKPSASAVRDPQELEIQIRERAYELYEARGREDGHDLEAWLRAEEEIMEQKARPIAA